MSHFNSLWIYGNNLKISLAKKHSLIGFIAERKGKKLL
jgi:hypothetical protein